MRLLLLQEKYLELLESGHEMEALHCLRHELAPVPLHHSDKQLEQLSSYMMYVDKDMLRKAAKWPGLGGGAREKLMDKLQGVRSGLGGHFVVVQLCVVCRSPGVVLVVRGAVC